MEFLQHTLDFFIHLDTHLAAIIAEHGAYTYAILFLIVFCETGLVITPFLPGDSLLFAAGAHSAGGQMNVWFLFILLWIAAVLGDAVNYTIGYHIGPKIFRKEEGRFFKKEHLLRTEAFYEKHGPKTIILARFLPIIRTFAPFVAGIGRMSYPKFFFYNVVGGFIWVALFLLSGYGFGNIPVVKENFSLVIMGIIVVSFIPGIWHLVREKMKK